MYENVDSIRTPQFRKSSNLADMIEEYMQYDKQDTWGFVIYRCTYASSADWDVFLASFRAHIRDFLEFYNGLDIFERLDVTVIDAPDGASTQVVREMFKEWSEGKDVVDMSISYFAQCQRFKFCLRVDEMSLRSIVQATAIPKDMEPPGEPCGGFVNVIWKNWDPEKADDGVAYEPIEGVTLQDVGSMRIALDQVVTVYDFLRDEDMWQSQYVRPPKVLVD